MIGANAAATLTNLVNAVNGNTAFGGWVEATTPFALAVVGDAVTATVFRIQKATARGGAPISGTFNPMLVNTVLTASITGGATAWGNDDLSTYGKSEADVNESCGTITLDATHIATLMAGGSLFIELPFTPTIVQSQFTQGPANANPGRALNTITDTVRIVGSAIALTWSGGTNLALGNVVSFWASA
ncbi:MAG TPA: hypothetical protein VKT80_12205 [Chloroflexota bacterium]|nr:hypothetical protein [Chloroflexota bacterium]